MMAGEKLKVQLIPDPSGNPGAIPHTFTVDLHGTLGSLKPMQLPVEVVPAARGGCSYPFLCIKAPPLGEIRVRSGSFSGFSCGAGCSRDRPWSRLV